MTRSLLIALGLIVLAVLAFFCLRTHAPSIEADIKHRSTEALQSSRFDWANVNVSGRDITLTGTAPDASSKSAAAVVMRDLEGVRIVNNEITVAEQVSVPSPKPHEASINFDGTYISISGDIENETQRQELISTATSIYGSSNVVDELKIRPGTPSNWLNTLKTQIQTHLQQFQSAHVTLKDSELTYEGLISSADDKQRLENNINDSLHNNYKLSYQVEAPNIIEEPQKAEADDPAISERELAEEKAEKSAEVAANCQKIFDDLMHEKKIVFETSSSKIAASSIPLLESLAKATKDCPSVNIEIGGHTDTRGKASMNEKLSQARASSVHSTLISMGANEQQLTAKGYGETQPITEEKTKADLAKNRRIEFKMVLTKTPIQTPDLNTVTPKE